jgi:hypothetical protein
MIYYSNKSAQSLFKAKNEEELMSIISDLDDIKLLDAENNLRDSVSLPSYRSFGE